MTGERILIADDEPDVLDVACFTLELEGYRVTPARDGLEAVEQARQNSFALFLTDVEMPRMNGLDAFRAIRKVDPNIVGVTMTGYGTMSIAVQALKQGFSDFLVKPFTPDELSDAVNRSLEKERLRRENFRLKALIPLFELSRVFMTETHLPLLLEQVVQTGVQETAAARATLLLLQEEGGFEVAAHAGGERPATSGPWQELASLVLKSGQPLVVDEHATAHPAYRAGLSRQGSMLALPLFTKERPLGVLVLNKTLGDAPFAEGDTELLNILAGQMAVAIENARLFEEREEAYRELEQMDHMKSEFINIAAHELRTPLSLVIGYAGLLEGETEGMALEYVQSIAHNATRLRTIVDDMTNLRHLESQQAQLDLTTTDFRQVVQRVIDMVDPPIANQDVQVAVDFPPTPIEVMVDLRKIELVVGNLLSNAYKFSPPMGTVSVKLVDYEDEVQLSVQDEGPGIPVLEQSKIWKRFYQIEDSLTRVHGGMGLGLAIVKGMTELHKGHVWVESNPGEGSAFYIAIPKRPPD